MATILDRAKIMCSEVNRRAKEEPGAFFAECDRNYERQVGGIVTRVAADKDRIRLIMLSGPSASGKTTTSLKITRALEQRGMRAVTVSMDDFFRDREQVPRLPDGTRDFESLAALDLELLRSVLKQLTEKGEALLPIFNFKEGRRAGTKRPVKLGPGSVAIVEGLHALDPAVTQAVLAERILKVYVSVSSDFVGDDGAALLTARDARLIRRTVRDHNFRGSSPENTLDMWDAVCRGEDLYVRPFKRHADITVNSVFKCEPCLFKGAATGLFGSVGSGSVHYQRARHVIAALETFETLSMDLVPSTCMLREFFGGSIYFNRSAK